MALNRSQMLRRFDVADGSFTTGWNHQRVQPRPLCSNRYRNGEPLKLTRRPGADSCSERRASFDHLVSDGKQQGWHGDT